MDLLLVAIICSILDISGGDIVLLTSTDHASTVIECSSNSAITFKFTNKESNITSTIAECETAIDLCYLVNIDLGNSYTITHTGRGGILQIVRLNDKTCGTYECSVTYGNDVFASAYIQYIPTNTSENQLGDNLVKPSNISDLVDTNEPGTCGTYHVILTVVICVLFAYGAVITVNLCARNKGCVSKQKRKELRKKPDDDPCDTVKSKESKSLFHTIGFKDKDTDQSASQIFNLYEMKCV